MKVKLSHLMLTVILIVLIFMTMANTCVTFKPHYSGSMKYARFESFKERMDNESEADIKPINEPKGLLKELAAPDTKKTKESFMGIADSAAAFGSNAPIDKFSGTPGKISCDGGSSGLTNSMGGLCLDDAQQKLLRTRGGNATGGDFQIG